MEEKENQKAVNRTIQPYYSNDLLYPTEENELEEEEDLGEKSMVDHTKNQKRVIEMILFKSLNSFISFLVLTIMRGNQQMDILNQQKIKNLRITKTLKCLLIGV